MMPLHVTSLLLRKIENAHKQKWEIQMWDSSDPTQYWPHSKQALVTWFETVVT